MIFLKLSERLLWSVPIFSNLSSSNLHSLNGVIFFDPIIKQSLIFTSRTEQLFSYEISFCKFLSLINCPNLLNIHGLLTCLQKLPAASAFKPSVCKGETERQFLPLNLQLHRTIVYPPITPEKSECSTFGNRVCLDIVTVGGFVAHALKYKRISSSLLN